ncbi:hypothetical protein EXIGLDRAFT_770268 [Exidia glandulosa HHB12029]|uniref:Uncharacterized protein n=1 Tax=Exidia glandulosa HHB12029 TaxID=1314781 RepID=A0A165GTR0_EXIGL|nr:hypothetical protein EXIGLDRAFT_770268 [Exidia glandulosa HHB12029]
MASSLPPTKVPVVSDEGAGTYVKMPPTISDVEWISSHDIGTGINIVTGDIAKSPFIAVGKQRPSPMAVYYNSYVISKTSVDGCKGLVEAMAGCEDFNLAPLNFSVSVLGRVVESVRNSMSSLTCVLFWRKVSTETNYDRHGFVLSDDARTLAELDPGAFRNMYGDYFIAHASQALIFVVVAAIKALRQSQRSSLVGKLEGGLKGLQGHITKEVDEWVSTAHAAVEIQVFMSGPPRDLPMDSDVPSLQPKSFDDVSKLLQWFQSHEIGENRSAHLQSYYSLPDVNTIPDRLGIPLDAFWEIRKIRHLLLGCTTLAKSLPMPYSETTAENSLSDRFNKVTLLLCNAQGELPTDAKRRSDLDRELSAVRKQLDKVHEAFAVFQAVLQARDDEPTPRQGTRR